MLKGTNIVDVIVVMACSLFAIAISAYHLSFNGYLGLGTKQWEIVYILSENSFSLLMCFVIIIGFSGIIRKVFYIFVGYFIVKLIYHFSCYSGIYLFSPKTWDDIWSVILVFFIIIGCLCVIQLIRRRKKCGLNF